MRKPAFAPTPALALAVLTSSLAWSASARAQTPAPAATPAAPAPAPEAPKKRGTGPSLGLSPESPQVGGRMTSPAEPPPVVAQEPSAEWKFDVTGYFRAPMRMSWGPATTQDVNAPGVDAGTQFRTPAMVPDQNYIDWRYTNSFVGPWTELNFHYGNDRVKATVQIASYNLTDPGYRRLESNLGINQAFLVLNWPELGNVENLHLTLTVGGFTNRYGAAGRYDGGKYETYLFARTHVAGFTANVAYDPNDEWTFAVETGGGAKLEPIPFYGPPLGPSAPTANQQLPAWQPYPGPVAQESAFVGHLHLGAIYRKALLLGAHLIFIGANDNERSTAYTGSTFNTSNVNMVFAGGRSVTSPKPQVSIWGFDVKLLGGVLGDGYLGFAHLSAKNAQYLGDAFETIHSFGGWQLHDNYFGPPGSPDPVTGDITTISFQHSFSFAQYFWYPQNFWGQGPDLIATVFGMFNHVDLNNGNTAYDNINKLKFGAEVIYLPLPWFGVGGRYDNVDPDFGKSNSERLNSPFLSKFQVLSPRMVFRTDFITHEQILIQYSRYFYQDGYPAGAVFPYNTQPGAGNILASDKNAFQIAAIIWF